MPATQSKPTSRPKTMGRFIKRKVNFSVNAKPGAKVFLAGAFNNWDVTKKQMIDRKAKAISPAHASLSGTYEYKSTLTVSVRTYNPNSGHALQLPQQRRRGNLKHPSDPPIQPVSRETRQMAPNTDPNKKIKVLIVTPEITYLPPGMGNIAERLSAKAGGLADVSASLVSALFNMGVDVHVALPNYRRLFHVEIKDLMNAKLSQYRAKLGPDINGKQRIHLAEDRTFYYRDRVYSNYAEDGPNEPDLQREVINIIPSVLPDLIHCNDWMTGLVLVYRAGASPLSSPSTISIP